jgi:hypothetical protein
MDDIMASINRIERRQAPVIAPEDSTVPHSQVLNPPQVRDTPARGQIHRLPDVKSLLYMERPTASELDSAPSWPLVKFRADANILVDYDMLALALFGYFFHASIDCILYISNIFSCCCCCCCYLASIFPK